LRLPQGDEHLAAESHRARPLGLDPDQEPWAILEVHERQLEQRGDIDEADQLAARVGRPSAAEHHRVLGVDRDRDAGQTCEATDDRRAPRSPDLEERAGVDDCGHDRSHVVRLARAARHDVGEALVAAIDGIVAFLDRWQLVDARRQV
jgi:hypothetical protein